MCLFKIKHGNLILDKMSLLNTPQPNLHLLLNIEVAILTQTRKLFHNSTSHSLDLVGILTMGVVLLSSHIRVIILILTINRIGNTQQVAHQYHLLMMFHKLIILRLRLLLQLLNLGNLVLHGSLLLQVGKFLLLLQLGRLHSQIHGKCHPPIHGNPHNHHHLLLTQTHLQIHGKPHSHNLLPHGKPLHPN